MVIAIFDGKGVNCAGFTDETIQNNGKEVILRFEFKGYSRAGGFSDGSDEFEKVSLYGFYVVPKSDGPITIQFPEPGTKGAAPSGKWETYGRIARTKDKGVTK